MNLRRAAAAAVVGLLVGGATTSATAAPPPSSSPPSSPPAPSQPAPPAAGTERIWGVQPSSAEGPTDRAAFDYELDPGEVVEDWVGVTNHGDAPIALRVYASDAFTTAEGGFDLLPADQAPSDVGSWITMSSSRVELGPGARVDVPFTLEVPENATPGDHPGGIVASFASDDESGTVVVDQRVGARVYLRVAGELDPALTIEDLRIDQRDGIVPWSGSASVSYTVRNSGNVRLSGSQQLEVQGVAGLGGGSPVLDPLPELLPGAEHHVDVDVSGVWATGRTSAVVTIRPESVGVELATAPEPVVTEATVTSVPWVLLAFVVAVVAALWWWRRGRRRHDADADVEAEADADADADADAETAAIEESASTRDDGGVALSGIRSDPGSSRPRPAVPRWCAAN